MIAFESGIYVRIETCLKAPPPLPLVSGFSEGTSYRVMGVHAPSETSEAYLLLINDLDQLWFISSRHVRFARLDLLCPFARIPRSTTPQAAVAQSAEHPG